MEESHPPANRFSLSDIIVRVLIWYLISFPSKIRQITPTKVQETQMFKIELKKIFLIELSMFVPRSEENIRDHASLITIDLTQIDYDSVKVLWSKGHKPLPPLHPLLIKGRNLYRLNTLRRVIGGPALVTFVMLKMKEIAKRDDTPLMANGKPVVVNEQQVEKFLYTALKLLRYSRMTVVVLVSLPPPPPSPIYILYGILGSFGGKHSKAFNCKRIQERCGHVVYITS